MEEILNQTIEEKNMLEEDLLCHLNKQQEKALIIEDLYIHIESLERTGINEEILVEREYYIDLLQKLSEELIAESYTYDKTKQAELEIQRLMNKLIEDKAIEIDLRTLFNILKLAYNPINLIKSKANYIKTYNNMIEHNKKELNSAYECIRKEEHNLKYNANLIENTLKPAINAVNLVLHIVGRYCE